MAQEGDGSCHSEHMELVNIFDNLIENIKLVISQLKDVESLREPDEHFSLEEFWKKLEALFKAISHEATKISVAFSSPPLPKAQDCQMLIAGIERVMLSLVSVFYSLPKTQGITLQLSTNTAVIGIIQGMQYLLEIIKEKGSGCQESLNHTENVWECCDKFSQIPKDNRQAALMIVRQTSSLVKDAHAELDEALEGDGQLDDLDELLGSEDHPISNEDTWSDADRQFVTSCTGVLKVTKSCLKKINGAVKSNGKCDTCQNVSQLDDVVDSLHRVSPAVDDLVCVLYPPLRQDVAVEKVTQLANIIKNILEIAKHTHITTEDDASWVDFLTQAVQHNHDKIKDLQLQPT